jgi:hypothetical protein
LLSLFLVLATLILSSACGGISNLPQSPSLDQTETPVAPNTPEPSLAVPTAAPTMTHVPTTSSEPTATRRPLPESPVVSDIERSLAPLGDNRLLTFTISGNRLDDVAAVSFVAAEGGAIPLTLQSQTDTTLIVTLELDRVPGEELANYQLQLDNEIIADVVLADVWDRRTVQGAGVPHTCHTERIEQDADGSFFAVLLANSSDAATLDTIPIKTGDTVDVLATQDERHQIRIAASHNPELSGQIGWLETWIVKGEGAPPCPTPTPTLVPTEPPARLVQIPHMPGVDVKQARQYLQNLGFSVSVHERAPGLDHKLCNGWVSFTSPPERTYVEYGSHVKIFYRNVHQDNPPGC